MHETIIAAKIISKAKEQGTVKSICVEVGELAEIEKEELEEALKKLVKWNVVVLLCKAVVKCRCGYKGEPKIVSRDHDNVLFECPKCQAIPSVIKGQDIILKKVSVD